MCVKDEYKFLLAKAEKDFQFQVHLGHPGVAAGGGAGAAAGAGIGAAFRAIFGAGVGAVIGGAGGAAARAGIGAARMSKRNLSECERSVFTVYGGLGGRWKIHC